VFYILADGASLEYKLISEVDDEGKPNVTKQNNLLKRLIVYKSDIPRFMDHPIKPFTNNRGENDIRITKFQQSN